LAALVILGLAWFLLAPVWAQDSARVGVLTIRSGPIASCGRQMEEGLQFALKERGGMLAGRKVELFFGDSAGQPALTRAKTLELVERNGVHVLTGLRPRGKAPFRDAHALVVDLYRRHRLGQPH